MPNKSENRIDGLHFKMVAEKQQDKLLNLAQLAEKYLETDISDDAKGEMRATAGQARLIVKKKFPQFFNLCERNLNPAKNHPAVNVGDLEGFWDLIMIEVRSINKNFKSATSNANVVPHGTITCAESPTMPIFVPNTDKNATP